MSHCRLPHMPIEWSNDDEASPVSVDTSLADEIDRHDVESFNFDNLDSIEDKARQHLADGKPIAELLEEVVCWIIESGSHRITKKTFARVFRVAGAEVASRIIGDILKASEPKFRAVAMAHEWGLVCLEGRSIPETAKKYGKSKQAVIQEMERVREDYNLVIPRSNQRSDSARNTMRICNYKGKADE